MKLNELLSVLPFVSYQEEFQQMDIISIETDSRNVKEGSLFICIKGFQTDGHLYVEEAILRGAIAIIAEEKIKSDVPVVYVTDTVRALAMLANQFYDYPTSKIPLIGITGTNGKTTVSYLLDTIFQAAGKQTGLIGTVENRLGKKTMDSKNTTPDALVLQDLFNEMENVGIEQAIMEVSSHGLDLGRVYGCDFNTVVFTNLSQDHLDFHTNESNYFQAKSLLFSQLGNTYDKKGKFAILNADDSYAPQLRKVTAQPVITYAIETSADVMAEGIELFPNRSSFQLKTPVGTVKITSRLTGKFNIYNMLAASTAAVVNQVPLRVIQNTLKEISPIPGRFEGIDIGQPYGVIVDYAHTPDAVQNILKTCRELTQGKLYCVLGCGGDRDKKKRPLMAEEAVKHADYTIFTLDNPRTEEPTSILEDMIQSLDKEINNYEVVLAREEAIFQAIQYAKQGDFIVIAGKGHETYQEIHGKKHPFDDRLIAKDAISHKEFKKCYLQ